MFTGINHHFKCYYLITNDWILTILTPLILLIVIPCVRCSFTLIIYSKLIFAYIIVNILIFFIIRLLVFNKHMVVILRKYNFASINDIIFIYRCNIIILIGTGIEIKHILLLLLLVILILLILVSF